MIEGGIKLDIKNIALVRATNIIPFDGIVYPISEAPYLKHQRGTAFAYGINDLLRKNSKINEEGYWTKSEEERKEMDRQNHEILEQYLPYNSDYNSMVLWSLNGLVPDDMNNTFSSKSCAIIESLEEQIHNSEIVSPVPTDTAIKGNVKLSNQAIILINQERYDSLSEKEKKQLESLEQTVQVFDGELQQAVNDSLENSEKYTAEKLSLTRSDQGYIESNTKDELIQTIHTIAEDNNIAQVLHWNVLTGQNDELDKLKSVKDEFKNGVRVSECYQKTFFTYLFSKLDIDKEVCGNIMRYMESPVYIQELMDEIEKNGIDQYKEVVTKYNNVLEILREKGQLPTPEQIVDFVKENKNFTLNSLIDEVEMNKQHNNFSIEAMAKIDETVTFSERKEGMDKLRENIKEIPEKSTLMEEKDDDSRI